MEAVYLTHAGSQLLFLSLYTEIVNQFSENLAGKKTQRLVILSESKMVFDDHCRSAEPLRAK
jgi:hypothetical protein